MFSDAPPEQQLGCCTTPLHEGIILYTEPISLLPCRRTGAVVEVVPETPDGDIDMAALANMLGSGPKPVLVSISHVPTSSGGCLLLRGVMDARRMSLPCHLQGLCRQGLQLTASPSA